MTFLLHCNKYADLGLVFFRLNFTISFFNLFLIFLCNIVTNMRSLVYFCKHVGLMLVSLNVLGRVFLDMYIVEGVRNVTHILK